MNDLQTLANTINALPVDYRRHLGVWLRDRYSLDTGLAAGGKLTLRQTRQIIDRGIGL